MLLRHPEGQPWRISIWEVNSMQRSFSLIVFIAQNTCCHGGLVFRWAPLKKRLLTLSHRDGFIRHINTSMPDPPSLRANGPTRDGFNSSLCPWELCKTENNTHFRFAGDMKLGQSCTKLSGDTNLSWELPASTALAPK